MSVFLSGFMGEWIGAQDQFSSDVFVSRSDSFPMNPEKNTLIFLIFWYNASIKDPF